MKFNIFNRPQLDDVLQAVKDDVLATINKINIGIIQNFFPEDQTAEIQIAIKRISSISLEGVVTYKEVPLLVDCPTIILSGGAGALTFPISQGDECLVLFNDREIDNWFAYGGVQTTITQRVHHISDGIALVGLRSIKNLIEDYLANGIRLALGTDRIEITPALIASFAALFQHSGAMKITGTLEVDGNVDMKANATVEGNLIVDGDMTVDGQMKGTGGTINIADNLVQAAGKTLSAGNGVTGTFSTVTVVNGIVTGGTP